MLHAKQMIIDSIRKALADGIQLKSGGWGIRRNLRQNRWEFNNDSNQCCAISTVLLQNPQHFSDKISAASNILQTSTQYIVGFVHGFDSISCKLSTDNDYQIGYEDGKSIREMFKEEIDSAK